MKIAKKRKIDKNKPNNQNISEKVKFDKKLNFSHDINLKINGAIVILRLSTICG